MLKRFIMAILLTALVALSILTARPAAAAGLTIGGEFEVSSLTRVYEYDYGDTERVFEDYTLRLWLSVSDDLKVGIGAARSVDPNYGGYDAALVFLECVPTNYLSFYVDYQFMTDRDGHSCNVEVIFTPHLLDHVGIYTGIVYRQSYDMYISGAWRTVVISEDVFGDVWIEPVKGLRIGAGVDFNLWRETWAGRAFAEYTAFDTLTLRYERMFVETGSHETISLNYVF